MDTVAIEIEAMAPEALSPPTAELRWYLTGRHTHGELVRIEGTREAVEAFVRLHWGDDEFDRVGGAERRYSPDEFFQDYGVEQEPTAEPLALKLADRAWDAIADGDEDLADVHRGVGADGHWDTVTIIDPGAGIEREYVLVMSPYC